MRFPLPVVLSAILLAAGCATAPPPDEGPGEEPPENVPEPAPQAVPAPAEKPPPPPEPKPWTVKLEHGRALARVDGVQVFLDAPAKTDWKSKRTSATWLDRKATLSPLLDARSKPLVEGRPFRICLDPGHGGSDPGAINGSHKEKVYTLQIAKRLQTQLEKLGFRVIMTRTGDTYPTLQERAALCKKYKPDLFLSIHCNSATNKTPAGIETYRAVPVGGTETKGSKVKTEKQSANEFDANNSRLAYEIQKGMIAATGGTDRGTRHQAIYVTGNATCPAVLVEVGYLSNAAELKKIASPEYQNKIVTGILAGLAGYGSFLR